MLSCTVERERLLQTEGSLRRVRRLDEAFELYRKNFSSGEMEEAHLTEFASTLLSVEEGRLAEERALTVDPVDEEKGILESIFSCFLCRELFLEPVTLVCGHTFCLSCLSNYKQQNWIVCPRCGLWSYLEYSLNIVVRELMRNWFGEELLFRKTMAAAEKLLAEGKICEFMNHVGSLMEQYPDNVDLFYLRSRGFLRRGWTAEALQDLEIACGLKPFKSKVFFSRGELLSACGDYEEAVMMFLRASALKPDDDGYRASLVSCLNELFGKICKVQLPRSEKKLLYRAERGPRLGMRPRKKKRYSERTACEGAAEERLVKKEVENVGGESLNVSYNTRTPPFNLYPESVRAVGHKMSTTTETPTEVLKDVDKLGAKNVSRGNQDQSQREGRLALEELECKLCFNLIYEPVTTPCGHSFCRSCLSRCLDHRFDCPCCRTDLERYLEMVTKGNGGTCQVLEKVLCSKFEKEYHARKVAYETELKNLMSGESNTPETPIFVCTLAVPDIACPLHIFEPRYKLMVRRCMESGTRQFGMCVPEGQNGFATVGTMLEINNVEFLPDGRSIVHTVGGSRFKVLEKAMKDGYNTAKIEWLTDEKANFNELKVLSSEVYNLMTKWFSNLPTQQQVCIFQALGQVPDPEQRSERNGLKWLWWLLQAMPLNIEAKLIILSMTSLTERLSSAKRFLDLLLKRQRGEAFDNEQNMEHEDQ